MSKKLQLFNGRLAGYRHDYIAAYSRADAVRIAEENFGLRGWQREIRDYWHHGSWGNPMIGITPRRGMFAEMADGRIVEFVNHKACVIERDDPAAWEAHKATERRKHEEYDARMEHIASERRERLHTIAADLQNVSELTDSGDAITFEFDGRKYEIREVE